MNARRILPWRDSHAPVRVAVYLSRLDADLEFLPDADCERRATIHGGARRVESHATRHFLLRLLAARLGRPASTVSIVPGVNGKPCLAGGEIEFSVSHRKPWCGIALSADCPVGVDVEAIHRFADMETVAAQFFPPPARTELATAVPEERPAVFFRWWTRIEAAVKATGRGLDAATSGLGGVVYDSYEHIRGLALAVAAKTTDPLVVDWHIYSHWAGLPSAAGTALESAWNSPPHASESAVTLSARALPGRKPSI
jgi:4'-phosphopantetheinyl transferase